MIKTRLALVVLLIGLLISTTFTLQCTTKGNNPYLSARVDSLFIEWDKPNSPGCALAVIKNGEIIYKRGYGMADLEHDISISTNTIFYIGSISKQFVAMCILLLEQDGRSS